MKFEKALITRVIDTGDVKTVRKALTSDHFFLPETRQAWTFIVQYFMEHGLAPSREMLQAHVHRFEFVASADPVLALTERVHEHLVYNKINLVAEQVTERVKTDVLGAASLLADESMRLRTLIGGGQTTGVDITTRAKEEYDSYYRRKNMKGLLGYAWPWERLTKATHGLQASQLVIFYARPKSLKTWILLYALLFMHYKYRLKVVLFTREMREEELRRRYVAMLAGVDYERYQNGALTTQEEARWLEALEVFVEMSPMVIDTVSGSGQEAADEMISKAQDHGADLIGADGIYFFGNREWEEIGKFTSRLKYHLLNTHKVPCIGTSQGAKVFSMKRNNMDDVGYSDTLAQDSDILIKMAYIEEDQRIYMNMAGARDGKPCALQIWARPAFDFSQAYTKDTETSDGTEGDAEAPIAE